MIARPVTGVRAHVRLEDGVTLSEMLVVMVILLVVLAGMTTLFLSASNSQIDQTNRVDAQLNARLALDSLRRELRCASAATVNNPYSLTITLPGYCQKPVAATPASFTWCSPEGAGAGPYSLRRYAGTACSGTGVEKADSLTSNAIFTYNRAAPGPTLGTPVLGASVDNGFFSFPTYAYVVTAVTSTGEVSGTIREVPIGTGTPNQITLTWSSVTGASSYNVYGRDDGTFTNEGLRLLTNTTLLTYTDMGCTTPAANCSPAVVLHSSLPSPPLATVSLYLEVEVTTADKTGRFKLEDDVVLRNSGRY